VLVISHLSRDRRRTLHFHPPRFVALTIIAVTLLAMLVAACGGSSMSPSNFVGTYTGTIMDSVIGRGIASITLTREGPDPAGGTDVYGTWSTTFPDGSGTSGDVLGLGGNESLVFSMVPAVSTRVPSACSYPSADVTLTRSGNVMNGTYTACRGYSPNPESGTLTLARQ
jgi:hypothetical protein